MQQIKAGYLISILIFIQLFCSCINDSSKIVEPNQNCPYKYTISFNSLNIDTINITMQIDEKDLDDTLRLLAPPIYADNPFLHQSHSNFHNLSITDNQNASLEYTTDSLQLGEHKSLTISFLHSSKSNPVTINYDVTFSYYTDSTMNYMPIPSINKKSAYLQGNYLYTIPYNSTQLVDIWRENIKFQVEYITSQKIDLFGASKPFTYYSTPYELMFSNIILFNSSVLAKQLLFEGNTAGQAYRCINYSFDKVFSNSVLEKTKNHFDILLEDITPKFGVIGETPFTIIIGLNNKIGLEGMHAFWLRNPYKSDKHGVINMTMAHEFIHNWIGIRTGEMDMPWWKEGTATYLGYLIAKRNNICTQSYFEKGIMVDLSNNEAVNNYSFSNDKDYIRKNIYKIKAIGDMVYRKGAQISMLIDRQIREKSDNKKDLVDFLGHFTTKYSSNSFYSKDYIYQIKKYSQADITDLFSLYVEGVGPIPDSILKENLNALIAFGALGE